MIEKVLLVDDEVGIRRVLGLALEELGYQVHTAENGRDALDIFQKEHPRIVLTDIKMPGMDGIDVLKRIKNENPETEVIVITGHGDMDLAIKSLKNEATDFITKPIDDSELENALQKAKNNIIVRQKLKEYTENLESMVQQKTKRLSSLMEPRDSMDFQGPYQHLFEEIPGYVIVLDHDLYIKAANRQFKNDFEFNSETDSTCYQVLKQKAYPCSNCRVITTFETGNPQQFEAEYKDRSGKIRNVMAWTTALRDEDENIDRAMVMSTDITRIRELNDHLSSLGLMVGSVSHAIKGMLTGLDGGVYLLDTGFSKEDPDKISEGIDIVKLMTGKIKNMVLDILYYSKERELNFTPTLIGEFFENIVGMIKPKMEQQDIAFEWNIEPELKAKKCLIDGEQLQIALTNILENAIDACLENKSQSHPKIGFNLKEDDTDLVFEIFDTGPGMDEKTKEKIFNLFFSSKSNRGTGIGLFITQKIINQHNGKIEVATEPGKGARFIVRIRKKDEKNKENENIRPSSGHN